LSVVLHIRLPLAGTLVDWPKIRARINQPAEQLVDVALVLPGGAQFLGHLEDATAAAEEIASTNPPHWAEPV